MFVSADKLPDQSLVPYFSCPNANKFPIGQGLSAYTPRIGAASEHNVQLDRAKMACISNGLNVRFGLEADISQGRLGIKRLGSAYGQ
jgi:hypothetical protein